MSSGPHGPIVTLFVISLIDNESFFALCMGYYSVYVVPMKSCGRRTWPQKAVSLANLTKVEDKTWV